MPLLARPDGAEIWWEETGEGPAVLICNMFNLAPLDALVGRLATERRVITYEPRGLGRSTRRGPYDFDSGIADLEALLKELGPVEVALGMGDGAHRAMRLADTRPDLVDRVVITSTALGRSSDAGETAGFSGSTQVLSALMSLLRRDYRSGLRSMVTGSGSFATEEEARERVEALATAIPQDAAVDYVEAWIEAGSVDVARRLGGRLTVLAYGGNDWFPLAMYEDMREFLTEACFEVAEDGPMNRPDLTAGILLRVSEPATG
jgi:pimeloyl-ACP methyl ester carboxylesterase